MVKKQVKCQEIGTIFHLYALKNISLLFTCNAPPAFDFYTKRVTQPGQARTKQGVNKLQFSNHKIQTSCKTQLINILSKWSKNSH